MAEYCITMVLCFRLECYRLVICCHFITVETKKKNWRKNALRLRYTGFGEQEHVSMGPNDEFTTKIQSAVTMAATATSMFRDRLSMNLTHVSHVSWRVKSMNSIFTIFHSFWRRDLFLAKNGEKSLTRTQEKNTQNRKKRAMEASGNVSYPNECVI